MTLNLIWIDLTFWEILGNFEILYTNRSLTRSLRTHPFTYATLRTFTSDYLEKNNVFLYCIHNFPFRLCITYAFQNKRKWFETNLEHVRCHKFILTNITYPFLWIQRTNFQIFFFWNFNPKFYCFYKILKAISQGVQT